MMQSYEFVSPSNGTFPLFAVSVLPYVALFICDLFNITFRTSGGEGSKGRIIHEQWLITYVVRLLDSEMYTKDIKSFAIYHST
jgi:hypothetical protein